VHHWFQIHEHQLDEYEPHLYYYSGVPSQYNQPIYHYRWNEEEAYKLLKSRIELENFPGKTARAVKQDFHARVFLMTLCAAYAHPIEDKVVEEYKADQNINLASISVED
jgi:hypothetical protein